ncbi:MAG: glycoside hydrolase family 99-like domain-containing protein [Thermoguttaceae bacterium]
MKRIGSFFVAFVCLFASATCLWAEQTVLYQWRFSTDGDAKGWTQFNHIEGAKVENGALHATISGPDPFLVSPEIDIAPKRWQCVDIRLKTGDVGSGEFYYAASNEGPYNGFSPQKMVMWKTAPSPDESRVYRIFPFWENENKITKFRIDLPNLSPSEVRKQTIEIAAIRVVDLGEPTPTATIPPTWNEPDWSRAPDGTFTSKPFSCPIDDCGFWVSVVMKKPLTGRGTLTFATDSGGFTSVAFPLDGRKTCNVPMADQKAWNGKLQMLGLAFNNVATDANDDQTKLADIVEKVIVSDSPQGPVDLRVDSERSGLTEAFNRAGEDVPFTIRIVNEGGTIAKTQINFTWPQGVATVNEFDSSVNVVQGEPLILNSVVRSSREIADEPVRVEMRADGVAMPFVAEVPITITPKLSLPDSITKAAYIPDPQPVASDYEIGALYFPGWSQRAAWDKIESAAPIRKPVLGWYDESNPECIDWQIKWAVESGISFFLVDWYWHKGNQHLDHWISGFQQAKFKKYLKWAMMWANHNPPGSHSEEDQTAVVDFWIANYFNTPEYYTIDGKPVVMIWSPSGMDDDIIAIERQKGNELKKGEGVKRLLELSRAKARAAGLKGIYFVAMKWPEASTDAQDIQWLKDAGFDMTSIYHFMDGGGKAPNPRWFDFKYVVDASLRYWESRQKTGILPFWPNLSTGWDDRPWHQDRGMSIVNRSAADFRKICEDYRKFADATGVKSVVLAPLNEWGEGSYIEPNREFGFGMYEALRETLCKKPATGWPPFYTPRDIGRGPYDLPPTTVVKRTAWDFKDGPQGWEAMMGVADFSAGDGRLSFTTTNSDPAIRVPLDRIAASNFERLVVRMEVTGLAADDRAQLFWETVSAPIQESASVSVVVKSQAGGIVEYVFDVSKNPRWKGRLTAFRLDPINKPDVKVNIESIRLE